MTDQSFAEGGYDPAEDQPTAKARLLRLMETDGDNEWASSVDVVDALFTFPGLLIDLAIEAGGLERVGYRSRDEGGPLCLYRRTPTEESHE